MNYEKNIKVLEEIVQKLVDGKLGVEESLDLYAKGISCAKETLGELNALQGKLEVLNKELNKLEAEVEVEDGMEEDMDKEDTDDED